MSNAWSRLRSQDSLHAGSPAVPVEEPPVAPLTEAEVTLLNEAGFTERLPAGFLSSMPRSINEVMEIIEQWAHTIPVEAAFVGPTDLSSPPRVIFRGRRFLEDLHVEVTFRSSLAPRPGGYPAHAEAPLQADVGLMTPALRVEIAADQEIHLFADAFLEIAGYARQLQATLDERPIIVRSSGT